MVKHQDLPHGFGEPSEHRTESQPPQQHHEPVEVAKPAAQAVQDVVPLQPGIAIIDSVVTHGATVSSLGLAGVVLEDLAAGSPWPLRVIPGSDSECAGSDR